METSTLLDEADEFRTGNEFRIPAEARKKVLGTTLLVRAGFILFFLLLGFFLSIATSDSRYSVLDNAAALTWTISIFSAILLVTTIVSWNRNKNLLEYYRLVVEDDRIKRVQYNTPDLYIRKSDIVSISENLAGQVKIQGRDPKDIIFIPAEIERKQELDKLLGAIKTIEFTQSRTFISGTERLRAIAALAAFLVTIYSKIKEAVIVSGLIYIFLSAIFLYHLSRDKNAGGTRAGRMIFYFVMFAYVIYRMWRMR